jgi:hypothetical protein
MDTFRDHPSEFDDVALDAAPAAPDVADVIGSDERRMHVRAYNYWCSLCDGGDFPSIEDIDPSVIEDFGPNSVIVDLTGKLNQPATPYVGSAIKAEIGVDNVKSLADVPGRSLLSRLTDHYFQIIATRAPVGFEAEFVNQRGEDICYRGILMPFSSDGDTIDFVYGVISWKVKAASSLAAPLRAILPPIVAEREDEQEIIDRLLAEEAAHAAGRERRQKAMALDQAPHAAEHPAASAVAAEAEQPGHRPWEDGPLADSLDDAVPLIALDDAEAGLADRLCAARESAEICKAADGRSRAALYRALAMAYDFAVAARRGPDDLAEILDDAGVKAQARAPMTPIVKLVFGADYDKTRLTEFAAALSNAEREGVDFGGFEAFLTAADGGLKGLVAAERKARRPDRVIVDRAALARNALRRAAPLRLASLPTNEEFALVLTRRNGDGIHEVVQLVSDSGLLERALLNAA